MHTLGFANCRRVALLRGFPRVARECSRTILPRKSGPAHLGIVPCTTSKRLIQLCTAFWSRATSIRVCLIPSQNVCHPVTSYRRRQLCDVPDYFILTFRVSFVYSRPPFFSTLDIARSCRCDRTCEQIRNSCTQCRKSIDSSWCSRWQKMSL